jgi:Uma2 family endonuclease
MAESDLHRDQMVYLIEGLKAHFAGQPDVYVSGDNFIYYQEGNPRKCVSPDVYVVFGVPRRPRDTYMVWKEGGKLPDVVIEVTSKKTRREDVTRKGPLYEKQLRIPEYYVFDPTGDYLNPRLQAWRLVESGYVPAERTSSGYFSPLLGLFLVDDNGHLRLYEPDRSEPILSPQEQAREIERLRAELERLREDSKDAG